MLIYAISYYIDSIFTIDSGNFNFLLILHRHTKKKKHELMIVAHYSSKSSVYAIIRITSKSIFMKCLFISYVDKIFKSNLPQ